MTLERNSILNKRYRILEILGEGGMGAVYKAVDENLGVTVAVKENLFTTEEYTRQFQIEATILAALRHPNLPRVTDHFVVEEEGQYLVMDFIEGEDLRDRMDRLGTLPDREVIAVGVAMCEALTYLHTRTPQVLHRDMKPGNVKISPTGQIFLVDFGLAKIVQGAQITLTGARAMTPGYSPPEQYGTARTDARSDVYSLGATLYSAVTGSLPEDGLARAMNQVELTPVRKHNPRVSRRLANTIEKSLAVLPDDRYQSAEEFKKALTRSSGMTMTRSQLQTTLPPPPAFSDDHADQPNEQISSKPREAGERRRISGQGKQKEPTPKLPSSDPSAGSIGMIPMDIPVISQAFDDEDQAFSGAHRTGNRRKNKPWLSALFLVLLLAGTLALAAIIFPDQARQAFSMLPLAPIAQTPLRTRPASMPGISTPTADETSTPTAAPPSPTASFTPSPTASPTSTPTPTFEPSPTPEPTSTPTFAPTPLGGGNSQIAFVSDASGSPQIYLMNTDGTDIQPVATISGGACQPKWSPDGTRLVFISPCAAKLEEYFGTGLYIINADGTDLIPLPSVQDYDPAWSPDGSQIAFTSFRNGNPQLFIMNLDDYSTRMLANTGLRNIQPAWSPDGSRIAFISTRQGPYQVWLMNADGSEPERFARSGDAKFSYPAWSPDGQFLVFSMREPNAQFSRFVAASLVAGGDSLIRLLDDRSPRRGATYSADGAWIVFEAWPDGVNHDIYIMRSNGQDVTRLTTSEAYEFDPVWRPGVP